MAAETIDHFGCDEARAEYRSGLRRRQQVL